MTRVGKRALVFFIPILGMWQRGSTQVLPDSVARSVVSRLQAHSLGYPALEKATKEIGHRLTGSPNGRLAEEFVFNWLVSRGLTDVRYDSFPVKIWTRESCRLEVVPYRSDNFVRFGAVSLSNTPSADQIYPLLDGGDGLEADLNRIREKIPGKCLLLNLGLSRTDSNRRNLHRAEKVGLALRFGAAAVLFVHPTSGGKLLTGTASLSGERVSIPALCISAEDGKEIRLWGKTEKLMADFRVKNEEKAGLARNVLVHIPAAKPTRETILFTAHLDSWDLATGAVDNGLGAFTLLDVADQIFRNRHLLKRNVRILWTMGEEQGLLGSRHYSGRLEQSGSLGDIRMVVNLDMVGAPLGFNHFDWPGMAGLLKDAGTEWGFHVPNFEKRELGQPHLHSDHEPFMLKGIPVTSAISVLPDSVLACYHADCDDFGLVNKEDMIRSAQVHSLLGLYLGARKRLPVQPLSSSRIPKWLESHGLKEKLQISGEWKWK